METTGGVSVADLVQRHTGSRPNLPSPPPEPPQQPNRQPVNPPRARMTPAAPAAQPRPPARPAESGPHAGPQPGRRAHQGPAEPTGTWQQPAPRSAQSPSTRLARPAPGPWPQETGRHPMPQNGRGAPRQSSTATQSAPPAPRPPRIPNQLPGQASLPPMPGRPPHGHPDGPQPMWPTESPSRPALPPARRVEGPSHPAMLPVRHVEHPAMPPVRHVEHPAIPPVDQDQQTQLHQLNGALPAAPPRPPAIADMDPICLTTEMDAISEETQKRRRVDHTLARFSKVHDELRAEEREKKAKRRKLMPWSSDDELDRLDEIAGLQSPRLSAADELAALDGAAEETRLQRKKTRKRQRSTLVGKILAGALAILIFVATGVAWGFKNWVDSNQHQVDALDQNSAAITDRAAQYGDENFLMVGSDTREGAAAEDGVGDSKSVVGARADTIMIAHVPANRQRVVVISFPRDLEVNRPACQGWDDKNGKYTDRQVAPASNVKINSIYGEGGPKCVTKVVQELSGIAINHFVGIDFNGFKGMVEAVDGVQVCVERPLKDEILGTVVKEAGTNVTLTGDQALNFVRARHVRGDPTSDYGRIIRQQRFLSSLLRKAMSSQVLFDPGKLTGFISAFSNSTYGDNIGTDQLFLLGQSMQGLAAGRVTFITVPTVGEANARGNEVLRKTDNDALFKAIRDDTPLPGEAPAPEKPQTPANTATPPPAQTQTVDPKTIKVQVLNGGNKTQKLANKTAEKMKEFGYQIVRVDNALEAVSQTTVKYGVKDKEAAARTLASSIPGAQLQLDPSAGGGLLLIIGPEYKGDVVAPNGAGGTGTATPPTTELPKNLTTVNAGDVSCA
jgi:LCP family protein required for cell wall assembly